MPRNAALRVLGLATVVATSCVFAADYRGHYTCHDGKCPAGLTCGSDALCVASIPDAGSDAGSDASGSDASMAALTCGDPGVPVLGGTVSGTTVGRSSTISANCNSSIMNGPDAVYRVHAAATATITVTITGNYAVAAYLIAPCTVFPATPLCGNNTYAVDGAPLVFQAPATTDYFVIVDGVNAGVSGTYTLGVTVN